MKKFAFLFIAAAAILAVGCKKDNNDDEKDK